MTREQEERELRERAGIQAFRERFESYLETSKKEDANQVIGRQYDLDFDVSGDMNRQVNEKMERIDREFFEDRDALKLQNLEERRNFDNWVQWDREVMREQDTLEIQQQDNQVNNLTGDDREMHKQAQQWEFAERERARNEAESELRADFKGFQDSRHAERDNELKKSDDENRAQLNKVSDYMQPLPWENETETQERAARAIEELRRQQQEGRDLTKNISWGR